MVCDQNSIKVGDVSYFSDLYKKPKKHNIEEQLAVLKNMPLYFKEKDQALVGGLVSMAEVERSLKAYAKDKSPGPDGWTIEFYLQFFDFLGGELVASIEDARVSGVIPESLNVTFLTLIPKVDRPLSFSEYRPIALCNLLYKLISKIIASCMKEVLGRFILAEQFGFLPGKQIMDAAGIVQETIHSIRKKKLSSLVLKLDLEKAFDKVDRYLLHPILVQIRLPQNIVQLIMSCVNSATFLFLSMVHRQITSKGLRV